MTELIKLIIQIMSFAGFNFNIIIIKTDTSKIKHQSNILMFIRVCYNFIKNKL
jgi:hypothetical protein